MLEKYSKNFVIIIAVNTDINVAIHTGIIILLGDLEFKELRIANIVVGIICNEAVFNTINIIMELDSLLLLLLFSCNFSIAFNPNGVAAFPNPKIFATIFIEIFFFIFLLFLITGNKKITIGLIILIIFSIKFVLNKIFIIPFHKHIVPVNVKISLISSSADLKIPSFNFLIFLVKKENIIETIINIGHNLFNIFFSFFILIILN